MFTRVVFRSDRPPATLEYFKGAGYEEARVEGAEYTVTPRQFFVKNQAETLL